MKWKRNPLYVKRVRITRPEKYALKILKLRKVVQRIGKLKAHKLPNNKCIKVFRAYERTLRLHA